MTGNRRKERIDLLLTHRGYFRSRERARRAVRAGSVYVDGQRVDKPGRLCPVGCDILLKVKPRYVSRGGEKIEGAIRSFGLDVTGWIVLDAGSSTGGFTDCLLQAGARRVYCLDVGKGQLDWKLRQDPRVVVKEGCNVRYLRPEDIPEKPDLITVDVSFISLMKVLPPLAKLLDRGGKILALIKPQFEAGRKQVGKGGVVRDSEVRREVIEKIRALVTDLGMISPGVVESSPRGPAGNQEYFILMRK